MLPINGNTRDHRDLVRNDEVHCSVYTDGQLFDREISDIFQRAWILLGHECQVPERGDHMLGRIGTRSVIIVRDDTGVIRVLENRCAHRGATVCSERRGNSKRFTCPYHAWTFALDGSLMGMPLKKEYRESFDYGTHGLKIVPHVELYRGFIFASYGPPANLEEFLGAARFCFDDMVDRSPEQKLEMVQTDLRYIVKANWKMVLENLNDSLHPLAAHASALAAFKPLKNRTDINPVYRLAANSPSPEMLQKPQSVATPYGHSYIEGLLRLANVKAPRDEHFQVLAARRGEEEAERILNGDVHVTLLYPSATINSRMQTIRLIRPISVDETEVVSYVFKLVDAPEKVLTSALDYVWISSSPASIVVVDDFEVYERCQESYKRAGDAWCSVHRAVEEDSSDEHGNLIASGTSEGYIRNQYRVWSRYLGAEPS